MNRTRNLKRTTAAVVFLILAAALLAAVVRGKGEQEGGRHGSGSEHHPR